MGERIKLAEFEYDGEERLFVIGPDSSGNLLELVAIPVAVRTQGLRVLSCDVELELTPGKAKKDITTLQAKAILASVRPRDLAGKTRRSSPSGCRPAIRGL